ncbi:diaminopimelate decarboxylase [Oleidesulfovibrio sp.]|uniref:diaminopimelate decarboxylase n=1 Tax=Oleidesulfovibrio sp. TaxID=2909707 RepID=UPI003A89B21C
MHHFTYRGGELYAEDLPIRELVSSYGTPLYVYSQATFERHFTAFDSAFASIPHLTCYSVKACSNTHILRLLGKLGAGMDIVSGGELYRALRAGIAPSKIVYSGVGKTRTEIHQALEAGILMFNVESRGELERINEVAHQTGHTANVSLRINPDVDPQTHPYISTGLKENKFGLDLEQSYEAYMRALEMPAIVPMGIDCHIGSQLTSLSPFIEAVERVLAFRERLCKAGLCINYLDLGGGLGIPYDQEEPPHPEEFGSVLTKMLAGLDITLILEPGRVIAGNAGILVTKVQYTKKTASKEFVIVDAAMNDLIRPSLYQSHHNVAEVTPMGRPEHTVDIVGPICESGDFLARNRIMPAVEQRELLAIFSAGAYGFTMSSQYNSRPRAAEVLVSGQHANLIRRRETYEDLIGPEESLP